jgi:very-long-chain enoyl-CoA reductase
MKVRVKNRGGRDLGEFIVNGSDTFSSFQRQFAEKNRKYYVERQWFTIGGSGDGKDFGTPVRDANARFSELGIKDGDSITFKDLGPQIAWRTVFFVEYAGPILMHALVYFVPQLFYSQPVGERHLIQKLAFAMVVIHYLKREYETAFVHHFSNATMPIFNIFKNSFHYWILGGLFIAYYLYHPLYTAPTNNPNVIYAATALFLLFELGNLWAHFVLRNLRPPGTRVKGIPKGGLFNLVTCANYTYEIAAWTAFAAITQVLTAYLFLLVSTAQIAQWALKKHIALKKEFGASAPKRKILFPFLW